MRDNFPGFKVLLACFVVIGLSACGGSGGGSDTAVASDSSEKSEGSVGILLTDMPADPEQFLQVNVSIREVLLLGGDDNDRSEQVFSGPSQTINLLDLRNESLPFAFQTGIPAGEYCKIRLILNELELVLVDDTPDDLSDNERHYPNLPGNNKLDLNARDCFEVVSDEALIVQLDIDARRSIQINEANGRFQFRPVVFVDVVSEEFDPKLTRIEGEYVDFDADQNSLLVCDAIPSSGPDASTCAEINLVDESAFFDNLTFNGEPRALEELFDELKLGQAITVVGWPIPSPERMFGFQENNPIPPALMINALAIELGDFLTLSGEVISAANSEGFKLNVLPGEPVVSDDLDVLFQTGAEGINGTRFVSKDGLLVDLSELISGIEIQVDGVLEVLSEADVLLKSSLIIIDIESTVSGSLTGTIEDVQSNNVIVSLDVQSVCGIDQPSFQFNADGDFEVLSVTITDTASEISAGGEFVQGQSLGLQGACVDQQYQIDSVVIIDDQRNL